MSKNSHVTKRSLTNAWTLRVAHALRRGPLRFNALDRAINAPNPPMLSTHLKKMARDGLVERVVIELGPPARVEYRLTPLGADLAEPASAMVTWVDQNAASRDRPRTVSRLAGARAVDRPSHAIANRRDGPKPRQSVINRRRRRAVPGDISAPLRRCHINRRSDPRRYFRAVTCRPSLRTRSAPSSQEGHTEHCTDADTVLLSVG